MSFLRSLADSLEVSIGGVGICDCWMHLWRTCSYVTALSWASDVDEMSNAAATFCSLVFVGVVIMEPGQVRGWMRTLPTAGRDRHSGVEVGALRKVG